MHLQRNTMVLGVSLVVSGAVMAGLGVSIGDPVVLIVLPTLGAALLAPGLVTIVGTTAPGSKRAAAIGGALVGGGTVMVVTGAVSTRPEVVATLTPTGAGLVAAGLLVVLLGANITPTFGLERRP